MGRESAARSPWYDELDRLEAEVEAVRALLSSTEHEVDPESVDTTWTPTSGLGPVPRDLLSRAEALLAAQRQVQLDLSLAMAATSRQRDFAARVTDATAAPAAPAYLDVSA
ncbi:hypothetical protein [Nocardioides daphniae]|uniref:Uncharacterized protein n=1 Tax=Nocardioides daphniae TaxID=402297 RepID=A0A4P7UD24_9ACTN|nr:hypothetical protein [Nocardioides daphniae]QCC78152.1 hypothetical protein E2C04_14900 [Nocardioides daphniae]GGD21448.1 hypothetical protein GCM10007231_20800 [Nocardioides daphniae]